MTDLRLTTATEGEREPLEDYWRMKYDALQNDSTPATIRSLRSQLQSIKEIATEADEDALERILLHCRVGLEISR